LGDPSIGSWRCFHWVRGSASACRADDPQVRGGQSSSAGQTVREGSVRRVFIEFFMSSSVLVFRSVGLRVFGGKRFVDGPYLSTGRFVSRQTVRGSLAHSPICRGASLVARLPFADSLTRPCRQSMQASRTVHPYHSDCPPGLWHTRFLSFDSYLVLLFFVSRVVSRTCRLVFS
jgi:hypothetical protein